MLPLRTVLAQVDLTVGAIAKNAQTVVEVTRAARAQGAQLVVFPELTLSGYPPRDLLLSPGFVQACERQLAELSAAAEWSKGVAVVVGLPLTHPGPGHGLHNGAAVIAEGQLTLAHKCLLPTYDVFDEGRYFDPGDAPRAVEIQGVKVGIAICEDGWNDDKLVGPRRRYDRDPVLELVRQRIDLLVSVNASPYALGKPRRREAMFAAIARRHRLAVAYVNLVGGNDGLLFDGQSVFLDHFGAVSGRAPAWREAQLSSHALAHRAALPSADSPEESDELLAGLSLGLADYLRKTGFETALLGLSGGIDSALTAVLAARALGPGAVRAVALPTRFNAAISEADARTLAQRLGIAYAVLPLERLRAAFLEELAPHFGGAAPRAREVAEENLQSRLRGTALMALSNASGALLLNTGNKSELAVGYCTLYGDMNGALAVIGDLTKTQVYRLARHLNRDGDLLPARTLERPPSAELREGQVDQETLPPYEVLDEILRLSIEEGCTPAEIVEQGHPAATVADVLRRVGRAEYKRRQAPPVLRVSERAFGEGWRYPIAQGYED